LLEVGELPDRPRAEVAALALAVKAKFGESRRKAIPRRTERNSPIRKALL